jgi:aerobic-type carbon monoxide dehydrogenase small subunit (CoxS/CutS family)
MQEISFIMNGALRRVIVDPQKSLLKVIREDLKLTGAKEGCSAGHCGTCAVLMNAEVVLACRVPVAKAQGKEITTIEGVAQGGEAEPCSGTFIKHGAVQCGYCTPGMI